MSDEKSHEIFVFWALGIFGTIFFASGLVTNVITMILFFKKSLNARVNTYLIALAAWDILLLLTTWVMFCLTRLIYRGVMPQTGSWAIYYPFGYFACNFAECKNSKFLP